VRGTKSYDREKAWPSINHSILSVLDGRGGGVLYGRKWYMMMPNFQRYG
jgi:hypothetical protein